MPIEAGQYLLDCMIEAGPVKPNLISGGYVALDWVDIRAYLELMHLEFEAWEARAIKDLSEGYRFGLEEGKEPLSISPLDRDRENTG